MANDFEERAKNIISRICYVTLATVTGQGLPWNSPVFAAYDTEYNFYFGTHKGSQKAKNIASNPNLFLVIYDSTAAAGTGEGVYIQAKAVALNNDDDIQAAHELLSSRHEVPYWKLEEFGSDSPLVLYKVTPEKFWMNDEGQIQGHYIDTRTLINL
jgi:general stress protein 26